MQSKPRQLTFLEQVWNIGFNIRYDILGFFEGLNSDSLVQSGDSIYFLGQMININKYNIEKQNDLLYKLFSQTPWLTYRTGFPELYNDIKGTYVTDTGWGCMIRVGQMAFAQIIRQHLQINTNQKMTEVINFFNDFDSKQPFSIHNIGKIARKQYGTMPGEWYNPSQISMILATLNQLHLEKKLNLSFLVFNNGNLFFDQVIDKMMGGKDIVHCNCPTTKKRLICDKCNKNEKALGLVLLTRIGLSFAEENYLHVLKQMMKSKYFKGVIGGKPAKALYFLGLHNQNSFIYLDPHYVHSASNNINSIKQSYFCGSFRICKATSIDPSLGINYYLRNFQQLNEFYAEITTLRDNNQSDFFIWMNEKTPGYINKSTNISSALQVEEDVYQAL